MDCVDKLRHKRLFTQTGDDDNHRLASFSLRPRVMAWSMNGAAPFSRSSGLA